ncbi:MAG: hypothetical protein JNK19_06130 [Tabrizicola sp.]|nr:hypothetical protein [Tabrizicola sp.]
MSFTAVLPILAAFGLGPWLAAKSTFGLGNIALRLAQGLLILFAIGYLVSAMNDSHYARTYWPSTPWQHALGPDWPSELFWDAARELVLCGGVFVIVFAVSLFLRRSNG